MRSTRTWTHRTIAPFHSRGNYARGLIRLPYTLQSIRDEKPHRRYIDHYVHTHHCLPLWVAAERLTFGTMSVFFDYLQQSLSSSTTRVAEP